GIVEDRIAEILDSAPKSQDGLADVNDLRCALPNRMDAKEFERLAVEQQFQHSGPVAQHLCLRQLLISGNTCFVGNHSGCQLFLGLADHSDFGNREDSVWQQIGLVPDWGSKHVRCRQPALLHRSAGESRKSDDITGGINMGNRRLEEVVDLQSSSSVRLKADCWKVKDIRVTLTPHRIQKSVAANGLAALKSCGYSISALVNFDCDDLLSEPNDHFELTQMI